ncbi:MAG: carboxypeptidase regulatory-like domain-containing protein, partial [Phycisphaerales bacterium]
MRLCDRLTIGVVVVLMLSGCGRSPRGGTGDGVCDLNAPECPDGQVCNAVVEGDARCATPVVILGTVQDFATSTPIEGALVQAVDVNGAAVGTSGATDSTGAFTLTVPAVRDGDGNPVEGIYTLRVQAASYQEFPTAIRPALPLDATTSQLDENNWVIQNALTTVGLIALPGDTSNLGSISGMVHAESNAGILMIAEGGGVALTGFSD